MLFPADTVRHFLRSGHARILLFVGATSILSFSPATAQQIDTARALSALRDAKSACEMDAGMLWQHGLCGPIALVDPQTRLVIANDTVAGRRFVHLGDAMVTTLPDNQYVANTSFQCGGRT